MNKTAPPQQPSPSAAPRVLLAAYACRPNAGSEVGIGWNWALSLARAGCEVEVLTAERNREACEAFCAANPTVTFRFHPVAVPWLSPSANGARHYVLWQWNAWRYARRLVRTRRFDAAVHVSYGSVHVPTQLWRTGLPTVFGPVGGGQTAPRALLSYFGAGRSQEERRSRITRLLPRLPLYRSQIRRMRVVLAANSDTAALLRSAGATDVRLLCDTGLSPDYGSAAPRSFSDTGRITLLWVGRFAPRKGLLLALDALQDTSPHIHLQLVGDGIDRPVFDAALRERGLEHRVHWTGQRSTFLETREHYRTHDALLFTSLRDSFGSQLLEAMGQGLPVIALSLSGARDFLPEQGAIKVEPGADAAGTRQRLAAAIEAFAALPAQDRSALSEHAWTAAQQFSWTRRADFMKNIVTGLSEAARHLAATTNQTEA